MAPRPSRNTWCTGMVVVPSTTWISSETLSSVGQFDVPELLLRHPECHHGLVTRSLMRRRPVHDALARHRAWPPCRLIRRSGRIVFAAMRPAGPAFDSRIA